MRELDVVQREEFEAVKEMARLAREENEALKARIEALEAKPASPKAEVIAAQGFLALSDPAAITPRDTRPPAPLEACRVQQAAENAAFSIGLR